MSDLEKLIKDLSNKVDSFQEYLDHLKDRLGKQKKHKKRRSRGHHRSPSQSQSRGSSDSRNEPHSRREHRELVVDPRHHLGERHMVIRIGTRRAAHLHVTTRKGARITPNVLKRIPHHLLDIARIKSPAHHFMTRSSNGVTIVQRVATRSLQPTSLQCRKRWGFSSRTPALPDWSMLVA